MIGLRVRAAGRRRGDDHGQSTIEWLGIAAAIIAILAVMLLAAPGMGMVVQTRIQCLIAIVSGSGAACPSGERAGEPHRPCTTALTTGTGNVDVRVAFINAGLGEGFIIRETSDGKVHVTFIEEGSLGASLEVGAEGTATVGGNEVGLGAEAGIGAALEGEAGDTRVFDNPEDAEAYINDRLIEEGIEALPPGAEQIAGAGKDLVDWITGNDPPQGQAENTHGEIGITVEGDASATAGPLSGQVEAAIGAGARVTVEPDGSRTVRLIASAEAAASLGIPILEVGANGKQTAHLELGIDADGNPEVARIRVLTEGAVDGQIMDSVADAADGLDKLTTNISGGAGQRSVITAELDLTDPDVADSFGDLISTGADAATGSADLDDLRASGQRVLDELAENGSLSVEVYDITDNGLGVGAEANLGIGLGADIGVETTSATLRDASFFDPVTGRFVPWEACLAGAN
ncbi:MAG TPA: hypothetical protein VMM13_08140 [Euzebya sp.]|nr:hypothetical protein [Euzebya sp.]